MAMLISRFHKLIQSKLLWATFLVIVVFTFVIWGTSLPTDGNGRPDAAPGKLNGKPVPAAQFRQAFFSTYLTVVMALGRDLQMTREIEAQLRQAAWQRLVALQAAERMGIRATDDEVFMAIQQFEGFSYEGRFNKQVYKSFVQNFLARFGFSERQFEEHVRQEIILQKTRSLIDRTTLITPLELQRAYRTVTDQFAVDYLVLRPELVEASVNVSEADARALYDRDPKAFTRPEQVRVDYVRIASTPYIPRMKITEDEVRAYYDEHLRDFIDETPDTNTAAAATNLLGAMTRYRPLEEVKQEISNRLLETKAREAAHETAMNLVVALTPDRAGNARSFNEVAAEFKLTVVSPAPFSLRDSVPGVESNAPFVRAAFELSEGPETYFSNPVRGSNDVYVIALRERIPARVPAFEEVKEDALRIARQDAIIAALQKKAESLREEAQKALEQKITFAEAMAFQNLTVTTTELFSASTGLTDTNAPEREILTTVMTMNRGEISDPVPVPGGLLVIYLRDRKPAETASLEAIRPQLIDTIRRQSARLWFDAWQAHLLRAAQFEDLRALPQETDEEPLENDEPTSG